ncbi:hypothetical protein Nepgr_030559 [Nepenthes gracilis]|uniref:DUF7148 domain-containing protein n=1 Tax=Nepenthes gracilis TaxID=150966 RepID=A0AAD3TGW1_NEPGR|nr:hypothetical protein Nepgr_030559 [Nepenthes gracilis]
MASATARQLLQPKQVHSNARSFRQAVSMSIDFRSYGANQRFSTLASFSGHVILKSPAKSLPENSGVVTDVDDEGVSLGTMKLPPDTHIPTFETLLFQWANSLCQGANLPLPLPLKIDKIPGGVRLGFVTIGDGETEVLVHIDCLVLPTTGSSGPIFRATRNGPQKDQSPPGEPRIMKSLLQALKKSAELARG